MNLIEIFSIIIIHFVADFWLQTEQQGLNKSKNWKDLLSHTYIYSFVYMIIGHILKVTDVVQWNPGALTLFVVITFAAHTITDYFTSKVVSRRFTLESPFNIILDSNSLEPLDILKADNGSSIIIMDKTGQDDRYRVKLYNSIPNFGAFTIIGFDQVLHYVQLFGTYYLLTKY